MTNTFSCDSITEKIISIFDLRKDRYIMEITKQTKMGDMIEYDRGIAVVLMEAGMHCVGCPASIGESLEEACQVHGLDADEVLKSIKDYLANK